MNKTDRMLALVLELQARGRQRAEDLAATFETSKRTIYRDIQALCEAGVPIMSMPGHGYSLMQGYFLPPLSFTTEEATMLLFGGDLISHSFDAQYEAAARDAVRKIAGVLPERVRDEVRVLQESIHILPQDRNDNPANQLKLQQLRRAILSHKRARFLYYTRSRSDEQLVSETREADPYGLVHFAGGWHLTAYCHLRQDIRHFRLDRIEDLEVLTTTFQRPSTFDMHEKPSEERDMIVRVLFDHDVARWVRENRNYYAIEEEETDKGLLITLAVRQESAILQWLLSWGRHARVLEPESLRQRMLAEASAMVRKYEIQGVNFSKSDLYAREPN